MFQFATIQMVFKIAHLIPLCQYDELERIYYIFCPFFFYLGFSVCLLFNPFFYIKDIKSSSTPFDINKFPYFIIYTFIL